MSYPQMTPEELRQEYARLMQLLHSPKGYKEIKDGEIENVEAWIRSKGYEISHTYPYEIQEKHQGENYVI